MSGFTLSAIREAIKAQLNVKIDGVEVTVAEYGESADMPRIEIELQPTDPITYFGTFGSSGIASARWTLRIVAGNADGSARIRLDKFLSVGTGNNESVVDALMSDVRLSETIATLTIDSVSYFADVAEAEVNITTHVNKVGANA